MTNIEKAELEALVARSQFNYLQNVMIKTPEYQAVQEQRKILNKADETVNLLKIESNKPNVDVTVENLKGGGYECREVTDSDGYFERFVICNSEIGEIGSLFFTEYGLEGISKDHGTHFYSGSDFLGFGSEEEEAWGDAVRGETYRNRVAHYQRLTERYREIDSD